MPAATNAPAAAARCWTTDCTDMKRALSSGPGTRLERACIGTIRKLLAAVMSLGRLPHWPC